MILSKIAKYVKRIVTRQEKIHRAPEADSQRQKIKAVDYIPVYANGRLQCIVGVA